MIKLKHILSEKSVSKQQQKFFGVVKAMQKGDIPKKGAAGKVAKSMTKKDVDKYASTKHKNLPDTVDEDEVDEGSLPVKLKDILKVKNVEVSEDEPESVKNMWQHHHKHPGTADGPSEPDTYDTDDDMQSDPGLQSNDPDEEEKGYEPVEDSLNEKGTRCWKGYEKKGMKTMFGKRVPNCVKREAKLPDEGFSEKDQMIMYDNLTNEDLRAWFGKGAKGSASGGGWDRYNTKGEKIGKCGDRKKGEGKPKCLSKAAAAKMTKKQRAAAVRKKRREDPNPDRRGKAKNVSSKTRKRSKKESVLDEKKKKKRDACYYKVKSRYKVWPSAYASGALVKCRKVGAKNWGNKSKK